MNDLTNPLADGAHDQPGDAATAAEHFQERVRETWETVQDQTGRAVRESTAYARENPVPVILGALALGVVVGLMFSGREPSARERYIDEPLEESHGILLGLLVAIGAFFRSQFRSASCAAEDLAERVSHDVRGGMKPLAKAAKRASKKFR